MRRPTETREERLERVKRRVVGKQLAEMESRVTHEMNAQRLRLLRRLIDSVLEAKHDDNCGHPCRVDLAAHDSCAICNCAAAVAYEFAQTWDAYVLDEDYLEGRRGARA